MVKHPSTEMKSCISVFSTRCFNGSTRQQVSVNPAYKVQEAEFALRKVGDVHSPVCISSRCDARMTWRLTEFGVGVSPCAPLFTVRLQSRRVPVAVQHSGLQRHADAAVSGDRGVRPGGREERQVRLLGARLPPVAEQPTFCLFLSVLKRELISLGQ